MLLNSKCSAACASDRSISQYVTQDDVTVSNRVNLVDPV